MKLPNLLVLFTLNTYLLYPLILTQVNVAVPRRSRPGATARPHLFSLTADTQFYFFFVTYEKEIYCAKVRCSSFTRFLNVILSACMLLVVLLPISNNTFVFLFKIVQFLEVEFKFLPYHATQAD